mgnify:CR=1 FL=1
MTAIFGFFEQFANRYAGRCKTYHDYRHVLDRKDVDIVTIGTPDHWHTKIAVEAMQSGKDVYCEKPLSLTIAEGRRLVQAVRRYQRVLQVGSQQRSDARFRFASSPELRGHDAIREAFEGVLDLDPQNLVALRHLAEDADRRQDVEEARRLWRQLQQLDPTGWPVMLAGAVMLTLPAVLFFLLVQHLFLGERGLGRR